MKKKILSIALTLCMLLTVVPLTPIAVAATTSAAEGTATITLVSNCDWGDGTGYQMLLDSTATAYGIRFVSEGPLARDSDSTEEVYSAFDYKIPADAGWTRDTQAVVHYGASQTIEIPAGIYDFCITNPTPGASMWIVGPEGDTLGRADNYEFKAGMHYTFTTSEFEAGDGVNMTVTDTTSPVITGIVNGKTYCLEVRFEVTDNVGISFVKFESNGQTTTLTADDDGYYTIKPETGSGGVEGTVIAGDTSNNEAYCSIRVKEYHANIWKNDGTNYWQECDMCHKTGDKKPIPSISIKINGADKACRMSEYVFSFEIPDGCKDPSGYIGLYGKSAEKDPVCTVEGNVAIITSPANVYGDAESFDAVAVVLLEDGYPIEASKTVSIQNEHTGGTATCTDKAVCEVCGTPYGEVDGTNHEFTAQVKNADTLKSAGTCQDKAVYYFSCSRCGEIDTHTFEDELDSSKHTDTKEWSTKNETQHEQTWKCCGEVIVALENHEWKDGVCEECGYVCLHTGETADCTHKAVCTVCGEEYGKVDSTKHTDTKEWSTKNETQHKQTWKCCGTVEVALENHEWKDGVCEECGYVCLHAGGTATCVDKAKCEVCGEEYGEINTANHTMLKHIEAKAATVTETGNTEYWHCEECGKYFGDKDCKNEIDLKDTVIGKLPPEIIDGKGQSITEGEKKELTFRSNGAFADFICVEVDGKTVDGKNYTVKEGSRVVTLKADYVATLSAGEHTLGIVSESGTAETTFTVNAKAVDTTSPQTGDNSHMVLWTVLLLVSGGAFVCTVAYGKKRKYSAK